MHRPPVVWLNGALLPETEARVSPFDHGLTTGDGVFETMRIYEGRAFAVSRHWRRLHRSAEAQGISAPDQATGARAIDEVIRANNLREGRVRVTVTAGPAPLGSEKGQAGATVIVAAASAPGHKPTAKVVTVPFRRNEHGALTNHKTTSYGENVLALAYAKARGGAEAIFANTAGHLCEGSGSNIFVVLNGALITPPISAGCLPGVTRALTLELCERLGVVVREEALPLEACREASEAFLTSSLREIQPVEAWDDRALPMCPGELTSLLQQAFRDWVGREMDP